MSAIVAALLPYFPHGLPADDAQAREMVKQAIEHLFAANTQTKSAPATLQPQAL